jgi:hypothetical protein
MYQSSRSGGFGSRPLVMLVKLIGRDLRSCGVAPAMASSSRTGDQAKTGMRPQFQKEPRRADAAGFFHSEAEVRESTGKAVVNF